MRNTSGKIMMGLVTVTLAASCGKKKEETAAAPAPSSVADLALSSALKIDIPDELETAAGGSSGGSLALTAGKKSSEACRVMETTRQVFDNLESIGNMFCHLEVEADQMKFGIKYNIKIEGDTELESGSESMNIWVDNSDPASLKVYMCEDGKLNETFTVSGFSGEGKVKGSLASQHNGSYQGSTYSGGINMEFDFTTQGVKIVSAKMKHSSSGGQFDGTFRSTADIKIIDDGLSSIKMSNAGTRGTDTMSDQGAVLFNGTMGQALFGGTGTYQNQSYDYFSRSTFDKEGISVASSTATADVVIAKDTLPEKLTDAFAPAAPAGWDCTGATESIVIDMTVPAKKAAHDACSNDGGKDFASCWGEGFEQGERDE